MNAIVMNFEGVLEPRLSINEDWFCDALGAAKDRYLESIIHNEFFSLVVVVDKSARPLAYCSYRAYVCNSGDEVVLNVLINYVYVVPDHRGKGLATLMVPYLTEAFLNFARANSAASFYSVSEIISPGGAAFVNNVLLGIFNRGLRQH